MNEQINPGELCAVTHDIVIEGQVAFRAGDRVLVIEVSPNAENPQYMYTVQSPYLPMRYRLSAMDLVRAQRVDPGPPQAGYPAGAPVAMPPQPGARKDGLPAWGIALIVVGSLLAVLLILGVIIGIPVFNAAKQNAWRRTCQSNLRTITGAINTYYSEAEQYPDSVESMAAPGPYQVLKTVLECPKCKLQYELEEGEPPTVECPGGYPDHTF